ncbi:MAG: hypothetical protein JWM95_3680 [Gemmatimonadetes bacterium]|nr:hypothetical protein [Gemmatimonadota bacterium]
MLLLDLSDFLRWLARDACQQVTAKLFQMSDGSLATERVKASADGARPDR